MKALLSTVAKYWLPWHLRHGQSEESEVAIQTVIIIYVSLQVSCCQRLPIFIMFQSSKR
jgi:hypothetical protein